MNYLVILDDGHGDKTLGKRTPIFPDGTFMHENDFNDAVVALMYKKLKRIPNVDVAFTAEENYDVPLNTRIARANQAWKDHQNYFGKENSKCILISVHANAYGDGKSFNNAKGVSTFCCSSPPAERKLAETIHKHLKGGTTQVDRGVQEVCFDILRGNMTSCLVECAFMTNLDEANLLKQEDFRQECADEITEGILEYFGINQEEKQEVDDMKTEFKRYGNGMTELKKHPSKLTNEIVNKRIWDIVEFTDCINGTFFYPDGKGSLYSTSILYVEGKTYQDTANHYWNFGTPQSVFIVYKDNTVDLKRIKFLSELDLSKVRLAIGGVGLRNTQDPNFYYSPVSEGFKAGYNLKGEWKDFTDVLRKTNKSVLGYNKRLNKCYLLTVPNVSHGELIKIISDNSTGEAYDIAISVDGGGSSFQDFNWEYVFQGENTRRIHNVLRFK
jgi:N-acetylmuramoyl-L-alanine amidase